MGWKSISAIGFCGFAFLVYGAFPDRGGAAVPVRLDPPPDAVLAPAASRSGLSVATESHYWSRATLEVTPQVEETVLEIAGSLDDTTVMLRVMAMSYQSDSNNVPAMREVLISRILDTGSGSWSGSTSTLFEVTTLNGDVEVSGVTAGAGPLQLRVRTPNNYDLLTLTIEAVTNKAVTFTEFF